ncbi:hypothetical protein GOB57_24145 [Sinorhizobium meliloti]|nr:hypothetical protein [Sinorhizobium meliloti]
MKAISDNTIRIRHRITPSRIDALKMRIAELLPEVPASHRVEALARGLQFRTWASLLAWKKTNDGELREVDASAFVRHLGSRGRQVPEIAFDCLISLTRPGMGGAIPTIEQALASMGGDTWEAWTSGAHEYEARILAQMAFVRERVQSSVAPGVDPVTMPRA